MDLAKKTSYLISENKLKSNDFIVDQDGKTILSCEQIASVMDTLEESRNETDAIYEQIEAKNADIDNSNAPLEEGEAEYISDGVLMTANQTAELQFNHFNNIDTDLDTIINDNLKDNLATKYDMTDEEAIQFAALITDYRARSTARGIDVFNVYPRLPKNLKSYIDDMVNEQQVPLKDKPKVLEFTARMILDELISDSQLDSLAIDMEQAMKELIPAPLEIYSEFNKDYIENEFLKTADKIREENPKTADNLLAMRKGYMDAYTYEPMYEIFKKSKIQKNVRRSEVLWTRTDTEYLRIAGICKFRLQALSEIHKALIKLGFTDIQSKRILTLFVYTYTDGVKDYTSEDEYNDIYRNSFANYFQGNIINLVMAGHLLSDFSKQVKDNLMALCNHIDSTIEAKEEELSNKKKKK